MRLYLTAPEPEQDVFSLQIGKMLLLEWASMIIAANRLHSSSADMRLAQRLWRWANLISTLDQRIVLAE